MNELSIQNKWKLKTTKLSVYIQNQTHQFKMVPVGKKTTTLCHHAKYLVRNNIKSPDALVHLFPSFSNLQTYQVPVLEFIRSLRHLNENEETTTPLFCAAMMW